MRAAQCQAHVYMPCGQWPSTSFAADVKRFDARQHPRSWQQPYRTCACNESQTWTALAICGTCCCLKQLHSWVHATPKQNQSLPTSLTEQLPNIHQRTPRSRQPHHFICPLPYVWSSASAKLQVALPSSMAKDPAVHISILPLQSCSFGHKYNTAEKDHGTALRFISLQQCNEHQVICPLQFFGKAMAGLEVPQDQGMHYYQ